MPRPPLRRRGRTAGFTLVEVMAAAVVMTLAIGTSLLVLARGFDSVDTARCLSYASQIMQSELERDRLTTWGDGTTAGTGTTGITAYSTTATTLTIDSAFTSTGDVGSRMTLTRQASDVHTGMIKITYTITWTTHSGHTMSRSYSTYYGKEGLYDYFNT